MKFKELLGIVLISLFFIIGIFIAREFNDDIIAHLDFGFLGMVIYVLIGILATVLAPFSAIPLIPIVVALWGPFLTAILSLGAWTIGAVIAFVIARRFGKPIVSKFINIDALSKYEK